MNKGLIARILAGGIALGTLGLTVRYTSQYDSIQEGIEALKEAGKSFYSQYLVSEEEKQALQGEFDTLKAQYLEVLTALGLEEGATLEDIQNKLNELSEGEKGEVVTEIANLLGVENATMEGVTQAISELEATITQLEADISRLQTELEQANLDLAQANKEEEDTLALLNGALAELEGLQGEIPNSPEGTPEEPTVTPEEPTVTLDELKAIMDSAWATVEEVSAQNDFYYTKEVKKGSYKINENRTSMNVAGSNKNVNIAVIEAIEAWELAKANYTNNGGVLE